MGTRHLYWILTGPSFAVQGEINKNFANSKLLVAKLLSFINFLKVKKVQFILSYNSSKNRQERQRRHILHIDVSKVVIPPLRKLTHTLGGGE
jgi:hypothetical protein